MLGSLFSSFDSFVYPSTSATLSSLFGLYGKSWFLTGQISIPLHFLIFFDFLFFQMSFEIIIKGNKIAAGTVPWILLNICTKLRRNGIFIILSLLSKDMINLLFIRFNHIKMPFFVDQKCSKNKSRFEQLERHLLFYLGYLNRIKMLLLPKLIYKFNAILITHQYQQALFCNWTG